jgi:anti-sigma B factor antagonist
MPPQTASDVPPPSGTPTISVHVNRECHRTVVAVCGELDASTTAALETGFREADSGEAQLVVDLRRVEFMDASGLRALIRAEAVATVSGRSFAIVPSDGPVQRLLAITGMSEHFTVLDWR